MPRMRLVKDAYEQLRKDDPDTNITMYALRTIVKSGVIPTVKLGRKTLVNYDSLLEFFMNGDDVKSQSIGTIRKVI